MRLFGWFRKEPIKERITVVDTPAVYHIDVYKEEGVYPDELYEKSTWYGSFEHHYTHKISKNFLEYINLDGVEVYYKIGDVLKFEVVKVTDAVTKELVESD